jgi:hypothetical protein
LVFGVTRLEDFGLLLGDSLVVPVFRFGIVGVQPILFTILSVFGFDVASWLWFDFDLSGFVQVEAGITLESPD